MKPLSREAQALLDSARAAGEPSEAYRAHMRRRLAARIGGAMGAAATVAVATKAAAAEAAPVKAAGVGVVAKVGVTLAVLGVLAGGAAVLWRDPGSTRVTAQQGIEAIASRLQRPISEAVPEPESDAPATPAASMTNEAPVPEAPPANPRRATALPKRTVVPSSSARPTPDSALNEELDLLSRAQGALSSGQAGGALALLEEHAAAHPDGALREERTAARVFALCALGRREEARVEAQRFVQNAPRSPLATRVRTACPAAESPTAKPE